MFTLLHILVFLITNYTDLLSLNLVNKLSFILKWVINSVILIIFNIFLFITSYTIYKSII